MDVYGLFNHSPMYERFSCFKYFATINNAVMVFFCFFFLSWRRHAQRFSSQKLALQGQKLHLCVVLLFPCFLLFRSSIFVPCCRDADVAGLEPLSALK